MILEAKIKEMDVISQGLDFYGTLLAYGVDSVISTFGPVIVMISVIALAVRLSLMAAGITLDMEQRQTQKETIRRRK